MGKSQNEEMKLLYEDHWDSSMDPNVHNIRTKKVGLSHHCPICKSRTKIRCYMDLHWAFCIAPIEIKGETSICGERYTPKSPGGCGTHHFKHGFNQIVKDHWKMKKTIVEAFEDLELAGKAEKAEKSDEAEAAGNVTLNSTEPGSEEELTYEQYNELNKQKELDAKRNRHEAMTNARAEVNAKGGTQADTKS